MNSKAFFLLFLLVGLPAHAVVPVEFAHVRDASGPAIHLATLAEVRLDAALLAATRPGLPDLRVFDDQWRETPFLVEPLLAPRERVVRQPVAARVGEIRERAGNRLEVRCDLEPGTPAANAIEIRTPRRDFIRTVRIAGSIDGQFWQPLADAEIYDYARFLDFRRTVVPLPASECRSFTVEITRADEERARPFLRLAEADGQDAERAAEMIAAPFQIGGVECWNVAVAAPGEEPVLQEWPLADADKIQIRDGRTTEFVLNAHRLPLTRLEFESPVRNFNRLVTIQIPSDPEEKQNWRTLIDGILTRIDVPGLATNSLSVSFPEQRVDRLRVVVQHANAPTIKFTGLRVYGPSYRLVWIAEPGARYCLAYGNDLVEAGGGDLAPLRAALANGDVPEPWQLAPPLVDPLAPAPNAGRPVSDYLPGGVLLGLSAAAWFFFARARKKAKLARAAR